MSDDLWSGDGDLQREVQALRDALLEAIGWSYGEPVTPEGRDKLERLLPKPALSEKRS